MRQPEGGALSPSLHDESAPRIVCISTDVHASAILQSTVMAILPHSRVDAADTSIVRGRPDSDCVIIAVGPTYSVALHLVRELRACGFDRSIILVAESPDRVNAHDAARLGVGALLAESQLALQLPGALLSLMSVERAGASSPNAGRMLASLRQLQSTLAQGEVAAQLPHRLNNPLAALLAEAQLLALEPMSEDHARAVSRIVELCRRVIDVSRSIEGIGSAGEF